jgi:hypothetical protein
VLALSLFAPVAAHAMSGGERAAHASGPATERQAVAPTSQDGLGWREGAIGGAIVIGIVVFGLWGDVAVGALIIGAAAVLGAGRTLVRRESVDSAGLASGRSADDPQSASQANALPLISGRRA